ncbi:amine oxidase [Peniophora sp. CONT]|nr:amine oxidase [Peniophora sp. CONT]
MYTALMLHDLGIPYKIIEARDRVGGRLFTYKFQNDTGAPYNYFDVGAMRFPNSTSMQRAFHLFDHPALNSNGLALRSKLRPYIFRTNNSLMSFNDVTNASVYTAVGVDAIMNDVVRPFATRLLDDLANHTTTGWEYMKKYDKYSTRAYLSTVYRPSEDLGLPDASLSVDVIDWLETFNAGTGWFDRALSETILEAVSFGWDPSAEVRATREWYLIDGGTYQIADTMYQYLNSAQPNTFEFNKRVTGISSVAGGVRGARTAAVNVTTNHNTTERFSHVVSTIPLPVMRTLDLSDADLTPLQSNALRELDYGPSVKIGMLFKTAWWTTGTDKDGNTLGIVGGQSYTDTPLRTVVYPSFGNPAGNTTSLIASYSWTEDANKLAALVANDQDTLRELTLRELANIHNVDVAFLRDQLIETFAWSWSLDPLAMGAFAFFGPGDFENLYTSLTNPAAGGRLHFAGEAISTRHAWVEGALDSAWRAVFTLLVEESSLRGLLPQFFKTWGTNSEWIDAVQTNGTDGGMEMDVPAMLNSSLLVRHVTSNWVL